MSRAAAFLSALAILAGLSGCRVFDRLTKERERTPADTAARTKDKDWLRERQDREPGSPPKDWLAGPAPEGRGNRVPAADAAEPASRGGTRNLTGILEDADGRPLPNFYITVENADPIKAGYGAPMGVESDRDGFFEINGLAAGEHYMLSAQTRGAKPQAGRISVQVPNSRIRLRLKEDYQLPPARSKAQDSGDLPPSVPLGGTPPKVFDAPRDTNPNNQGWSPLGPGVSKPSDTPPPPSRGDLVAPGNQPEWKSTMPPASIPGPGSAPSMGSPTVPSVPAPPLLGPTSKSMPRDLRYTVLGTDGKSRNLLTGRAEDLVLLDFMTTTCGPCRKSLPALKAFDDKNSGRVELIGVVCDDQPDSRKVELAAAYRKENRLHHAVAAESSRDPLQDRLGVDGYPTLVLLDGTGRRLWTGHPKDLAEVQRILRNR